MSGKPYHLMSQVEREAFVKTWNCPGRRSAPVGQSEKKLSSRPAVPAETESDATNPDLASPVKCNLCGRSELLCDCMSA